MIAENLKDENKITLLINKKLGEHAILVIITSMKEIKNIIEFINTHKEYLEENSIGIYKIVRELPTNWKMEIIEKIEMTMEFWQVLNNRLFPLLLQSDSQSVHLKLTFPDDNWSS